MADIAATLWNAGQGSGDESQGQRFISMAIFALLIGLVFGGVIGGAAASVAGITGLFGLGLAAFGAVACAACFLVVAENLFARR